MRGDTGGLAPYERRAPNASHSAVSFFQAQNIPSPPAVHGGSLGGCLGRDVFGQQGALKRRVPVDHVHAYGGRFVRVLRAGGKSRFGLLQRNRCYWGTL